MQHTQQYLNTLDKQQRGELWVAGVLAKQPDYDVQDLKDIWEQTENTHETYEQEADKMKWLNDHLDEALQSEAFHYDSLDDMFDDIRKSVDERMKQRSKIA